MIDRVTEDELRKELEEVKFALQVEENDNEYNCAEKDRLKAENERLRALTEWKDISTVEERKSGRILVCDFSKQWICSCFVAYDDGINPSYYVDDLDEYEIPLAIVPKYWKELPNAPQIEGK